MTNKLRDNTNDIGFTDCVLRRSLFLEIVENLHNDPALDFTETLSALLITELHIYIRFGEYNKWPHCLCMEVNAEIQPDRVRPCL